MQLITKFLFITGLLVTLSACDKPVSDTANKVRIPVFDQSEIQTAGGITHKRLYASYLYPGEKLSSKQQLDFWTGFSFFRDPWVAAPSATGNRDGLGPLFNTRSCIACHTAGSRAKIDEAGQILPLSLVVRLGSTDPAITSVDPVYGGQIQPRSISYRLTDAEIIKQSSYTDNVGEAWLDKSYDKVLGNFVDGEAYELLKPRYKLTKLAYGELAPHIGISVRLAPNIFGMGLLNAIKTDDLLNQEDSTDSNGDGISAKYNRVPNVITGEIEVGRFGFKAKQPNLHQQVAAAFRDDIGITNTSFTDETCTKTQVACNYAAKHGGHSLADLEIPDNRLDFTVTFNEFLGVPPARNLQSETVQRGRALFYQAKCQQCHIPSYVTDENYPVKALAKQTIWPYTDLALHDMGEGLADGVYEFNASGREWRTAPLWGIGLQQYKTGQQRFLHDGRARTISEAILWHGGEAEPAKQAYVALNKQQRDALVKFVKAI
ncbi:di-heme oxidoredictase family protein [Colwellia psychrerythraea]|uniref:Cytochrome c domain-containing protein n=1 Tax=Colwellia psychrerythraea TaxID=28229 RepID=A0A099KW41_COLPS|nr:di-heme oxidoredictase family protein [Colwellia psychrerythraea]KGJ94954.1 protein of unknown function DUF1111 [Colwellia psychrerythraea]